MNYEKNKIVFGAGLAVIILFLISYSFLLMGNDEDDNQNLNKTLVPALDENQKDYDSKLDAINDMKEVRETNAPSIYDEKLIDSLGFYDPDLPEREKERIVDSIYAAGKIKYSEKKYDKLGSQTTKTKVLKIDSAQVKMNQKIQTQELSLEHQLFFASSPKSNQNFKRLNTDEFIYAVVDGDQVVEANTRLRMRLTQAATSNGQFIPKNTPIFGFISFRPNRALISIENIDHHPTQLKAFDMLDGSEGIYVENNFREEASREVLDDIIQDMDLPGVPQISGVGKILQRRNRNVKVTVLNNYKLILKPKL